MTIEEHYDWMSTDSHGTFLRLIKPFMIICTGRSGALPALRRPDGRGWRQRGSPHKRPDAILPTLGGQAAVSGDCGCPRRFLGWSASIRNWIGSGRKGRRRLRDIDGSRPVL
ncbi:hypothetical protein KRMM14A1259_25230 [Krasilnikovia sp. MM14-A1259]